MDYKPTYWNSKGKYQKEYDNLYAALVPSKGVASSKDGELLRCISSIYYDYFNNGGGNFDVLKEELAYLKENRYMISFTSEEGEIILDTTPKEIDEIIDLIVEKILKNRKAKKLKVK